MLMALLALGAIVAGASQTFYFRTLTIDNSRLDAMFGDVQFRKAPGLRRFLGEVRKQLHGSARVAVLEPSNRWWGGYEYVFSRSQYELADSELIALVDGDDSWHPERVAQADFVIAWHLHPTITGFATVWANEDGSLQRKAVP
jgi:hypothetical protein